MIALCVLFVLLAGATWTDVARHEILNWNTYPGMLAGLLLNVAGFGVLGSGFEGLSASLAGFLACGFIMLFAFVFFQLGGGDVKLVAMMGAFLGVELGLFALLWMFSVGFVLGVAIIIWQVGFVQIVKNVWWHLALVIKARSWVPMTTEQRKPLDRGLFLAPSALIATVIVSFPEFLG
ncbi:MAG: A24 family peptidase [Planctomycetota bacterium]|nr:A24 family peptidase [Planctomycetota bacterium]MDA1249005.1 A24 family peptidase [Planctomycetota bacterium]